MFSLRSLRRVVLLFVSVALFAACVPTEIIATKDPNYNQKVESLYIQSFVSDRLDSFPVAAAQRIKLSMVSRSVPVSAEHVTLDTGSGEPPSLEDDVRISANFASARDGGASHIMLISEKSRETESTTVQGNLTDQSPSQPLGTATSQTWTFDVSLYDVEMEKRIWRGTVKQQGTATTSQEQEGEEMAKELISKLDEDQLLPPLVQGNGR